jgi:hypothetical protein
VGRHTSSCWRLQNNIPSPHHEFLPLLSAHQAKQRVSTASIFPATCDHAPDEEDKNEDACCQASGEGRWLRGTIWISFMFASCRDGVRFVPHGCGPNMTRLQVDHGEGGCCWEKLYSLVNAEGYASGEDCSLEELMYG